LIAATHAAVAAIHVALATIHAALAAIDAALVEQNEASPVTLDVLFLTNLPAKQSIYTYQQLIRHFTRSSIL